ncbi:SAM-dependent methyltransferase [Kangiella japonica]|uniref:SAM-dependent methyltransferase n=1 Tax=Kangiella japonica TaxID=647384 RepID=A0ABN0SX61_9GAMM
MELDCSSYPEFCRNFEDYRRSLTKQCQILEVPCPDEHAIEVSYQLAQRVSQQIHFHGKIPFSEFMQQALYAPGLGYYSAGSRKLGVSGDFVTAPEISALFGKTLALSVQQAWQHTTKNILEFGAGSGRLMCDILRQCEADSCLPDTYSVMEVSAELKQRQQDLLRKELPHLYSKVTWLEQLPQSFDGVMLANEVADAIPFELLMQTEQGLTQGFVQTDAQGFSLTFTPTDFSRGWQKRHQDICQQWPDGYLAEAYNHRSDWLSALLNSLNQGCVLLLDYGYEEEELYSPYRPQGTLQCYYRQKKHSMPLTLLGLQDITASVNFTQLAHQALDSGAQVLGFTSQAQFLTLSGIERFVAQDDDSDTMSSASIAQQLQTLLMPNEMGQNIKVLGLSKGFSGTVSGFNSLGKHTV